MTIPPPELDRFDAVERVLHWVNAALFASLMFTAAALYIGPLSVAVGRRDLVRQVHVLSGVALPLPFLLALIGPWRRRLRADIRLLNHWDDEDRSWLRPARRAGRALRPGKFHPGQKLNAAFTAGAIVVMLATGSIMKWFRFFPGDWRTGATFVHDWLAIAIFVMVTGHVLRATSDRQALRGMVGGRVPATWAGSHHGKWYDEVMGPAPARAGDDEAREGPALR